MRLAKLAVYGLGAGFFVFIGFLLFSGDDSKNQQQVVQQAQQAKQAQASRADDQTYAEEVRTFNAKTNQMKEEMDEARNLIAALTNQIQTMGDSASSEANKQISKIKTELAETQSKLNAAVDSLSDSAKKNYNELSEKLKNEKKDDTKKSEDSELSDFDKMKQNISKGVQETKKEEKPFNVVIAPPSNSDQFTKPITNTSFKSSFNNNIKGSSLTPDGYLAIKPFGNGNGSDEAGSFVDNFGGLADGSFWGMPKATLNDKTGNPFDFSVNGGQSKRELKSKPIPVATIPMSSILFDNTSISPLVGVVPDLTNNVNDPFRFRIMTGPENLSSNNIVIQGIDNIIWSGYVVGVRDQSCVRAYVDTVTYTFEDGRISTYEKGRTNATSTEGSKFSGMDSLGYLTDEYGKACIRGEYISNASKYLADRSMAAFLGGVAEAASLSQMKYLENKDGDLSGFVTGNTGKYIAGAGIAGTADEIAKYVADRAAGAMDLIYVQGGINVQLFIEAEIPINYDPTARKVNYEYSVDDLNLYQ